VKNPIHIELTPTNRCNQRCSYCFEGSCKRSDISEDEGSRQLTILAKTKNDLEKSGYDGIALTFWGGEPFLNVDFMLCATNIVCSCDFRISIYTNGTCKEGMDRFLKNAGEDILKRTSIQFSYDGEPHHSLKRGYPSDTVISYFRKFKEAGARPKFKATLALDMIDRLPEIWKSYEKLYDELGDSVAYAPTLDTSTQITEDLIPKWKKVMVEIAKMEMDFARKHGKPLMVWFGRGFKGSCRLTDTIHVQPDGKMYVCHACPYLDDPGKLYLGNTSTIERFDQAVLKKNLCNTTEECRNCGATYCTICHATLMKPDEDPREKWLEAKPREMLRCRIFQEFGKIDLALRLACSREFATNK
jgi:radical SAM protein with 4Fe4S-binding SPASM domain